MYNDYCSESYSEIGYFPLTCTKVHYDSVKIIPVLVVKEHIKSVLLCYKLIMVCCFVCLVC